MQPHFAYSYEDSLYADPNTEIHPSSYGLGLSLGQCAASLTVIAEIDVLPDPYFCLEQATRQVVRLNAGWAISTPCAGASSSAAKPERLSVILIL